MRYVWAPNKGSAKVRAKTSLPVSVLPELIGENPPETKGDYPRYVEGAYDPNN